MFKKIMIFIIIAFIGAGCETGALHLVVKFDHIHGLVSNDRVIFEKNRIGKVDDVTYTKDGSYRVKLTIEKAFENSATEHSRFYIVSDPQNNDLKAIEMILTQKGGKPLKNNAVVEGSSKSSVIIEQMQKNIEKQMEDLTRQFNAFAEQLKQVPDSEAYKKLEDELTNLYDQMKQSGKEVRDMIQKQILPRLEQELDNLKERPHNKKQKDELKPIETTIKKIKEI